MNKFKIYFLVISVALVLFSCSKDDAPTTEEVRAFKTQFEADSITIDNYLKTTSIQVVDHPGFSDDQDVIFTKIPEKGTEKPILDYKINAGSDSYPQLLSIDVELHNITYNVYYLKLRADNKEGKSPCKVDEVLTSFVGSYLKDSTDVAGKTVTTLDGKAIKTTKKFQSLEFPQNNILLDGAIRGWQEILPLFKTGIYDANSNPENPAIFQNFGAGVMFLPSGLAYYNQPKNLIPVYSPLVFSFKLYDLKRADQDGDGILSVDEDVDRNGNLNDDTDKDGIYNMYDIDDDGDGITTKNEIKNANGVQYSFDAIPDCEGNPTDSELKKRHLVKCVSKD